MNIGFTFDEKAMAHIDYRIWLERASSLGANSIELAPDSDIMAIDKFIGIASACSDLNIAVNYHVPYFISDGYSISNFKDGDLKSLQKYNDFLSSLETISGQNNLPSTIVIHGESFDSACEKTIDGTVEFLNYLVSELDVRKLSHTLSLETVRLGSTSVVGDNRADLISVLNRVDSDRLGICLDICHDSMNYFPLDAPRDVEFLSKVNYAHIHGYSLSSGQNHMSLSKSSLNFLSQASLLKEIKPDLTLSLESLSDFMGDSYLNSLFKDIGLLKSLV